MHAIHGALLWKLSAERGYKLIPVYNYSEDFLTTLVHVHCACVLASRSVCVKKVFDRTEMLH